MKKVLIIGPIEDFGGREIEAGFIANSLSNKYLVDICSTVDISKKSEVYTVFKSGKVYSLKELIFERDLLIRLSSILSFIRSKRRGEKYYYVNNRIAKSTLDYNLKIKKILIEMLSNFDLILIIAQLSSSYLETILEESNKLNKKIIFRTTGTIQKKQWGGNLNSVDLFIHHSKNNADRLLGLEKHKFNIIDQCSILEEKLIQLPTTTKNNKFFVVGMISHVKGFERLIEYFLKFSKNGDELSIIGDGEQKAFLKDKYSKKKQIIFKGYVAHNELFNFFDSNDCLIISSFEETGPLVGIEAMAAGKMIISTQVGAMPDRLNNTLNNFWYDINDESSFEKSYNQVKKLTTNSISEISSSVRKKYISNYSCDELSIKYRAAVEVLLG